MVKSMKKKEVENSEIRQKATIIVKKPAIWKDYRETLY